MSDTRKKKPRLVRALLALLLVGALSYGTLLGIVLAGEHDEVTGQPQIMIVLGCQVYPWGPSILLQDRLDTAMAWLDGHPDMTVVVTGGKGDDEPESEAACMRSYLIRAGVDESRILPEEQSSNTYQNMVCSARLIEERGLEAGDGVLIVSNGFHLARARMLWRRATGTDAWTLAAPSSHAPSRLLMHLREPLALVKSFIIDR